MLRTARFRRRDTCCLTVLYLARANYTLFFTSMAAFVCKKKTRGFRVFPPEN